jgi:hypothetical protein
MSVVVEDQNPTEEPGCNGWMVELASILNKTLQTHAVEDYREHALAATHAEAATSMTFSNILVKHREQEAPV